MAAFDKPITIKQRDLILKLADQSGDDAEALVREIFHGGSLADLTIGQASALIQVMTAREEHRIRGRG